MTSPLPVDQSLRDRLMAKWDSFFPGLELEEFDSSVGAFPFRTVYSTGEQEMSKYFARYPPKNPDDLLDHLPEERILLDLLCAYGMHFSPVPNIRPSTRYHTLLVHNDPIPMGQNDDMEEDLEVMVGLSQATGFFLFHNSPDLGGASQPQHEHYQLLLTNPPVARLEPSYTGEGRGYFPDHPGANIFFEGEDSPARTMDFLAQAEVEHHNITIHGNRITVYPRIALMAEALGSRRPFGGIHVVGYLPFRHRDDAKFVADNPIVMGNALMNVLAPPGFLDSYLYREPLKRAEQVVTV